MHGRGKQPLKKNFKRDNETRSPGSRSIKPNRNTGSRVSVQKIVDNTDIIIQTYVNQNAPELGESIGLNGVETASFPDEDPCATLPAPPDAPARKPDIPSGI